MNYGDGYEQWASRFIRETACLAPGFQEFVIGNNKSS
jgi:hypothetical protein